MADLPDDFELQDIENEDDLSATTQSVLAGVIVSDTDWTAETVLSQLQKGNIQLNPRFQRRETWDDSRKSRFIESLLLGVPVPQLVLAELPKSRGRYVVIDGKQRLLTLSHFAANKTSPLKLRNLQFRSDLNGLSFEDIKYSLTAVDDLAAFENAPIRTTIVRGWKSEEALYLIFYRLNSGSVPLSPQELRHVLHPGPFMDFAFEFSEKSKELIQLLGKGDKPDFRMRDVEMLIRFLGFHFFIEGYDGNLRGFLDSTAARLNERWSKNSSEIVSAAKKCEAAIETTVRIFGKYAFAKWTPEGVETRFNRAVFDVMCFAFSDPEVQAASVGFDDEIKNAFSNLCVSDQAFLRSLESTTKSVEATRTRLTRWLDILGHVIPIPDALKKRALSVGK